MTNLQSLSMALAGAMLAAACSSEQAGFSGGRSANIKQAVVIADQEFAVSLKGSESVSWKPAFGLVDQQIVMQEKPPVTASVKQVERTLVTDPFTQGNDGQATEKTMDISSLGKLDLLVVVDDSRSMGNEQGKLKTKLSALTRYLVNVDWQIAVVTTSPDRLLRPSCLRNGRIIKKDDADAEAAFAAAVGADTDGDSNEMGLSQALRAFRGQCISGNYSWLRPDSNLAVLFVSDEEDHSPGETTDYINAMRQINPATSFRAYALVWDNGAECQHDPNYPDETLGTRYETVVNAFSTVGQNGVASICQADYTATLEKISQDVARVVKKEIELVAIPVDGSVSLIMIDVNGVETNYVDYTVVDKVIKLGAIQENDRKLRVRYRHDAKPKFTSVTLSGLPDTESMVVSFDGAPVAATEYDFDADTRVLSFHAMPANDTRISVVFRNGGALPLTVLMPTADKMLGSPMSVRVGDQETTSYEYDGLSGLLTVTPTPADGVAVEMVYKPADAHIMRYEASVSALDEVRNGVTAKAEATGDALAVTIDNGQLVFDEADFAEGRAVVVTYDFGNRDDVLNYELPHDPLPGSLKLEEIGNQDASCIGNVAVVGRKVAFNCDGESLGEIKASYDIIAERYSSFTVTTDDVGPETVWQVFVDGNAVAYTRDGNVVSIEERYLKNDNAKVRVVVTKI